MADDRLIYMDNIATTPLDPVVLDAMLPYFTQDYGNAASRSHPFGWAAAAAVDAARASIAGNIGATDPGHIVFTSGATESINLALKGCVSARSGLALVTTAIEHKAVLDTARTLERQGAEVIVLPVDARGRVRLEQVEEAIWNRPCLVSIMMANNEVGTIQDLKAISAICKDAGALLHTDATQALGKIPFDVGEFGVDLASFSGHKIYGPKGVGGLFVDTGRVTALQAQMDGGGHEGGFRSGTLNVPGIVGFARALEVALERQPQESARLGTLRDQLCTSIVEGIDGVHRNGDPVHALPGLLNLSFEGLDADSLLFELSEVALSSGSACTSAQVAPSHVLKAMGLSDAMARASVRFGLGRFNSADEIARVGTGISAAARRLRAMAPAA